MLPVQLMKLLASDLRAAFETPKMRSDTSLLTSRSELQDLTVTVTKRHVHRVAADQVACGNLSMCPCVLLA